MQAKVETLAPKIEALAETSRAAVDESRVKIAEITTKTGEILDITKKQPDRVEVLLEERLRYRADGAVRSR